MQFQTKMQYYSTVADTKWAEKITKFKRNVTNVHATQCFRCIEKQAQLPIYRFHFNLLVIKWVFRFVFVQKHLLSYTAKIVMDDVHEYGSRLKIRMLCVLILLCPRCFVAVFVWFFCSFECKFHAICMSDSKHLIGLRIIFYPSLWIVLVSHNFHGNSRSTLLFFSSTT